MKVVVEVEKGANAGERYDLELNGYRAIGRSGDGTATQQFTTSGDHVLETDDIARVEAHLTKRAPVADDAPANVRFGDFKRGRDILIDDSNISRIHAMLFLGDDGPSIVDLLSTNGTRVNGQPVTDADLANGDVVNVGKARFVIHIVG